MAGLMKQPLWRLAQREQDAADAGLRVVEDCACDGGEGGAGWRSRTLVAAAWAPPALRRAAAADFGDGGEESEADAAVLVLAYQCKGRIRAQVGRDGEPGSADFGGRRLTGAARAAAAAEAARAEAIGEDPDEQEATVLRLWDVGADRWREFGLFSAPRGVPLPPSLAGDGGSGGDEAVRRAEDAAGAAAAGAAQVVAAEVAADGRVRDGRRRAEQERAGTWRVPTARVGSAVVSLAVLPPLPHVHAAGKPLPTQGLEAPYTLALALARSPKVLLWTVPPRPPPGEAGFLAGVRVVEVAGPGEQITCLSATAWHAPWAPSSCSGLLLAGTAGGALAGWHAVPDEASDRRVHPHTTTRSRTVVVDPRAVSPDDPPHLFRHEPLWIKDACIGCLRAVLHVPELVPGESADTNHAQPGALAAAKAMGVPVLPGTIAVAGDDRAVHVMRAYDGEPLQELLAGGAPISTLSVIRLSGSNETLTGRKPPVHPDQEYTSLLVAGSQDGVIRMWNGVTGSLRALASSVDRAPVLALVSDAPRSGNGVSSSCVVAAGTRAGAVKLFDCALKAPAPGDADAWGGPDGSGGVRVAGPLVSLTPRSHVPLLDGGASDALTTVLLNPVSPTGGAAAGALVACLRSGQVLCWPRDGLPDSDWSMPVPGAGGSGDEAEDADDEGYGGNRGIGSIGGGAGASPPRDGNDVSSGPASPSRIPIHRARLTPRTGPASRGEGDRGSHFDVADDGASDASDTSRRSAPSAADFGGDDEQEAETPMPRSSVPPPTPFPQPGVGGSPAQVRARRNASAMARAERAAERARAAAQALADAPPVPLGVLAPPTEVRPSLVGGDVPAARVSAEWRNPARVAALAADSVELRARAAAGELTGAMATPKMHSTLALAEALRKATAKAADAAVAAKEAGVGAAVSPSEEAAAAARADGTRVPLSERVYSGLTPIDKPVEPARRRVGKQLSARWVASVAVEPRLEDLAFEMENGVLRGAVLRAIDSGSLARPVVLTTSAPGPPAMGSASSVSSPAEAARAGGASRSLVAGSGAALFEGRTALGAQLAFVGPH